MRGHVDPVRTALSCSDLIDCRGAALDVERTCTFSARISLMVSSVDWSSYYSIIVKREQLLLGNRLCRHPACDFTAQEMCRTPAFILGLLAA